MIPSTAQKMKEELEKGTAKYNFDRIIELNIGNPQIFGSKPSTFMR